MSSTQVLERLRKVLNDLPEICYDFILSIEPSTTPLTRLNYAYDLRTFFRYLSDHIYAFNKPLRDLTVDDFAQVQSRHFSMYLEYLNTYALQNAPKKLQRKNGNTGKKRKLVVLRVFFRYLYRNKHITHNPVDLVELPKIKDKPIVRLEDAEVVRLLDVIEQPQSMTKRQIEYVKNTQLRDSALITLMLGTGIRVSECTGINCDDIDWKNHSFRITRKGGNEAILYFNDEVFEALYAYREERMHIETLPGHEKAFFLSLQNRRISQRSVQNLVKKYAHEASPIKRISPHKLRSTYGTSLYRKTGDIYLVADVLGHKDVNVTRRYYADMSEENRRKAAAVTNLRPSKGAGSIISQNHNADKPE